MLCPMSVLRVGVRIKATFSFNVFVLKNMKFFVSNFYVVYICQNVIRCLYIYIYIGILTDKLQICDTMWGSKKGTKSQGRSRDNWRKHIGRFEPWRPWELRLLKFLIIIITPILWVILSIYCFWFFFHIVGRLFCHSLTAQGLFRPINDFKTHFKLQKPTLTKAL